MGEGERAGERGSATLEITGDCKGALGNTADRGYASRLTGSHHDFVFFAPYPKESQVVLQARSSIE